MASLLGTVVGDFETQLATKLAVGGTTATLQSATDDDGVALPAGRYFFTIDGDNSSKEHVACTLSGTSLTAIKSVSRQGVEASGVVRVHRIGATVVITDFKHLKAINDLLDGTTNLNASVPLGYDGTASITTNNQLATKAYVDGVAVSGAPDANTTTKGIVQQATQAQRDARTATGSTGAALFADPSVNRSVLMHDYLASAVGTDAYAIALTPAVTAYTTGDVYIFKADVANTGAATLNVNALGAKTIKRMNGDALIDKDIQANAIVTVVYNGTDMLLDTVDAASRLGIQNSSYVYAVSAGGTDAYAITLTPAPAAYVVGQAFIFKADVANTGASTLNVNSLGAVAIKRNMTDDTATGDILANDIVRVVYDGTSMQMAAVRGLSSKARVHFQSLGGNSFTVQTGADYKIIFDTEDFDVNNEMDSSVTTITATTSTGTTDIYTSAPTFAAGDVGKAIMNYTRSKFGTIATFVSTTHVTTTSIAAQATGDTIYMSNSRFTAQSAGFYHVSLSMYQVNFTGSQVHKLIVKKNGSTVVSESVTTQNASTTTTTSREMTIQDVVQLAAGDYLEVFVNAATGVATFNNVDSNAGSCYWAIHRLS